MATGIGNLSLKLSLNPAELTAGLAKAAASIKDFGAKAPAMLPGFASVVKGAVGVASAAAGKFEDVLSKPLDYLSNFTKSIPYVGQTLALPFDAAQGLLSTYSEGAKKIDEMGRAAGRSGTDLASFQAIQAATKVDADALSGVLFKLNSKLTEGAMAGDEAAKTFARYGLSAKEVFRLNGVERFAAIADAVAKIKDPALQAKAAFDLVGKKGGDMLFALSKGGQGVRDKASLLDRLGLRMTDQDFANVRAAGEFAKTMKLLKESVTVQVTKGVAPFLAELADQFKGAEVGAKGLDGYVRFFLKGFVYAGSLAAAAWKGFVSMLPSAGPMFEAVQGWAAEFFATAVEGLSRVVELLEQVVAQLAEAGKQWNTWGPGAGLYIGNNTERMKEKMPSREDAAKFQAAAAALGESLGIGDTLAEMAKRYEEAAGKLGDAKGGGGAGTEDRLKAASDRLKAAFGGLGDAVGLKGFFADAFKDAEKFLSGVEKRTRETAKGVGKMTAEAAQAMYGDRLRDLEKAGEGPLDKYLDGMQKLNELYAATKPFGLMDDATYFKAAGRLGQEFAGSAKGPEPRSPAALLEGSREAYSAILAFQRGEGRDDPQKQLLAAAQEQLALERQQVEFGRRTANALENVTVRRFN